LTQTVNLSLKSDWTVDGGTPFSPSINNSQVSTGNDKLYYQPF